MATDWAKDVIAGVERLAAVRENARTSRRLRARTLRPATVTRSSPKTPAGRTS